MSNKLVHFRYTIGTDTPLDESLGAMFEMQKEGKILHVGLSCVSTEELNKALTMGNIVSVENAFGQDKEQLLNSTTMRLEVARGCGHLFKKRNHNDSFLVVTKLYTKK